ncbi:MAG: response regulator, partial [Pseudomonadales bacterium]|nr:response regulator [Pseudomonadales bacterium]
QSEPGKGSQFTITLPARNWRRTTSDAEPAKPALAKDPAQRSEGVFPALVVDDNASNRRLLQHLLTSMGYSCDTAAGGEEALALLQQRRYSWLFIDINMHPMDGPALLQALRKLPGMARMPCIACTALSQQQDSRRLREMGFDALMNKPIEVDQIAQLARRFDLTAPAKNAMAGKSHADRPNPSQNPAQNPSPDTTANPAALFDVAGAIAHASGNCEVARQITGLLRQELEQALVTQREGLTGRNVQLKHYHQLNGSASLGGTPTLKNMLVELEALLREDNPALDAQIEQRQAGLEKHLQALVDWLERCDLEKVFREH